MSAVMNNIHTFRQKRELEAYKAREEALRLHVLLESEELQKAEEKIKSQQITIGILYIVIFFLTLETLFG
jgi:hypothetical protein